MVLKPEYWHIYRAAYSHHELDAAQAETIKKIYENNGREAIFAAAKKKKLIPAVAALLCQLELDKDFWQEYVDFYLQRNRRVVACLDEMYRLLTENGVQRLALVENFGALLVSGQPLSMFGSGDIDQYADPCERERIYEILRQNGYELGEVKAGSLVISSNIRKDTFPEGFYFGINWDVTNRVNLPSFTAQGDFMGWDRCTYYKDTAIRLPSPEGLMYVCLLHIAVHGFSKAPDIRLYYDIANAACSEPDWQLIAQWAQRDGNCVKLSTAAYLSHRLLGVQIPSYIFSLGNEKQRKRLLAVVYDEKTNSLKDFPGRKARILIDVYSHEQGAVKGALAILFPAYRWIKGRYGMGILGYFKHLLSLL